MKKIQISHIKFVLLYTTFVYIVNNIIILDKFTKWFETKGVFDYSGFISYSLLGLFLSITLITILSHKFTTKAVAIFVILSSSFSTYFIKKYDVAIDRSMILNTINTNTTESLTLFSSDMLLYLFFLAIIPITFIIFKVKIVYDKPLKHLTKSILTIILSLGIAVGLAYMSFDSLHRAGNKSRKYIGYQLIPVNFIVGIGSAAKHYIQDNYTSKPEPKQIDANITKEDNLVVVLAIGESARQKNFSLYGYKRDTNPMLSKIEGIHTLNGIAKYGSTIWALPMILSRDDIKLPSITQHAGVKSSCFVNFRVYGNCGTVPEVFVNNCGHNGECYDEDVIPLLKKDIKDYKKGEKLVVLHIGAGSHGPLYATRYPPEFQKFNPQCKSADVLNDCTKEELYNSYDNTILYTDFVVANIIKTLEKSKLPYIFIYLSDHGESLLENGRVFHGMPPGIDLPYEQAHIPLLVKASVPIQIIKKDEYKQQDVYDTILDLLNINTDMLHKENVFIKKQ